MASYLPDVNLTCLSVNTETTFTVGNKQLQVHVTTNGLCVIMYILSPLVALSSIEAYT